MASLKDLIVKIGADTRGLTQGVDTAQAKLSSFGSTATSVGASLSMSLTAPIVAAGAGILAAAGNFEAGMNKVAAISGATGSDLEALTAQAKDLGASTKFSASQAAEGMSFLAMAGYSVNETMTAMPGLLSLAAASGMELGQAADIASNILSGFRLNADQAGRAADVLAKAAASSNTDVTQLGQAMKYVAPVAANVGMTIEQTAAYIGKLGDAGIQAEMAGTSLRGMIAGLVAPSGEAAKVLEKLGVSTADASGQMRPLRDILEQLKTSGASTAEMFAIFGRENASAALVLQDALPSYDALVAKLQSSSGAAGAMAETMQGGLNGALTSLSSAIEGLAIAIADSGLLDWAASLVVSLTDIIREVGKASPELLKMGAIAAGVVAAAGPLLVFIGSMSTALSAILPTITAFGGGLAALSGGPVTLAVAALVGLSGALLAVQDDSSTVVKEWKTAWDSIKSTASTVGNAVKTDIKNAWSAIVTFSGPIFDQIVRIADTAMGIVREILELPGVKQSVETVWIGIKAIVEGTWEAIKGIISGALSVIEGGLTVFLGVLKGDWQTASDGVKLIVEGMWAAIEGVFSGGATAIKNTLVGLKDSALGVFSDIGNELVGNSIVPDDIVDPTIDEFGRLKTGATAEAEGLKTNVSSVFGGIATTVSELKLGDKLFDGGFSLENVKTTLGSMGDAFRDKLMQPAKDALNNLIDNGISALMGALDGVIGKLGGVGGAFSGVFGGGGGIGGAVSGGGGGAASAASGGVMGAVGAIGAAAGAVSGIIGNFQNARQETTLNAIEESTRYSKLFIETNVVPALWQINEAVSWGPLVKAVERLDAFTSGPMFQKIDGIFTATSWGPNVKANERTAEEVSSLRSDIAALMAKLEQIMMRPVVLNIDGQEIARAVGAGQESLRATA